MVLDLGFERLQLGVSTRDFGRFGQPNPFLFALVPERCPEKSWLRSLTNRTILISWAWLTIPETIDKIDNNCVLQFGIGEGFVEIDHSSHWLVGKQLTSFHIVWNSGAEINWIPFIRSVIFFPQNTYYRHNDWTCSMHNVEIVLKQISCLEYM